MTTILTIPVYFILSLLFGRRRREAVAVELELRRLWRELESERRQTREERLVLEQRIGRRLERTERMIDVNAGQIGVLLKERK